MRLRRCLVIVGLALVLAPGNLACTSKGPAQGRGTPARAGVTEIDPAALPDGQAAIRRTTYVPVYSHVYTADAAHPFHLAVTLAVRNTDRVAPLYLVAVRYHDSDGRLVRDELRRPLRLAPLAAAEFFVKESDTTGGSSASFLVDWRTAGPTNPPVIEAVMVGTAMNQGVSLITPGHVVGTPGP